MTQHTDFAQKELVSFLSEPSNYPHDPPSVQLVQTHISYVAIAPPFVYKVKKPVDFGFLDFTTLEKRRYYCEEEVRLNRRLCTSIYEAVVPIYGQEEDLRFEPGGTVVDYAVKMKQLSDPYFLDRLIDEGKVTYSDLDRVVDSLVRFYTSQRTSEEITAWGQVDRIKMSIDENFEQTRRYVGNLIPDPTYETLQYYSNRFLSEQDALFERRRREGRILDCHGDLHLEHIHLAPEQVCIYDCIEFNERLRYIDVANDIAFLAMDLDHKGHTDFSAYVTSRLADELADPDLLRLIPFYASYRAYVRGKVTAFKSAEEEVEPDERDEARRLARSYFRLALRYALCGNRPLVIAVMGRVGSGKSTQAEALSENLGWTVASSDKIRKGLAGVPLHERGSASQRAELYSPEMTEKTYNALFEKALERGARGEGVILDATFGSKTHRSRLRDIMGKAGLPIVFVELSTPDETVKERLRKREHSTDVVSDARLEDFDMLNTAYEPPGEDEPAHRVKTGDCEETTEWILMKLATQPFRTPGA